jgi:hypothetical protein
VEGVRRFFTNLKILTLAPEEFQENVTNIRKKALYLILQNMAIDDS